MADENIVTTEIIEPVVTEPVAQEEVPENLPNECIVMADGTILECSAGWDEDRTVWVWFKKDSEYSLADLFNTFVNAQKTKKIQYYYMKKKREEWEGFTKLYSIMSKESGSVDIGLRKP